MTFKFSFCQIYNRREGEETPLYIPTVRPRSPDVPWLSHWSVPDKSSISENP